jgi:hypothetical protein
LEETLRGRLDGHANVVAELDLPVANPESGERDVGAAMFNDRPSIALSKQRRFSDGRRRPCCLEPGGARPGLKFLCSRG